MKYITLECKKCGASADVNMEDDRIMVYCPYCGSKKLIHDEVQTFNYNHFYKKEDVARIRESDNCVIIKEMELAHKDKKRKKESKSSFLVLLFLFIIGFGGLTAIGVVQYSEHVTMVETLEMTFEKIQIDIENGDYMTALFNANTLHYTARWSSDTGYKWDDIRINIIRVIEDAIEREVHGSG